MRRSRPFRLAWLAPFLVGYAAATAAEIAVGVLLYAGPGMMRSLTLILGVESAAFGVGMWASSRPGRDVVEAVRRRWLFCLTAFLSAGLFAAFWTFVEELGGGALGQGLGLAFLAALPLYACGSVLATVAGVARRDPHHAVQAPGAPAAIGAATGFVVTGVMLPQSPTPSSLLLVCIVLLSLGGLVQGAALARTTQIEVRARRIGAAADVRVEDRHHAAVSAAVRLLLEGPHLRRWLMLNGDSTVPWDVALARAWMPEEEAPWRVLLVGGGASALPNTILREHPNATVDVLERSAAVVELGREHMDTGLSVGVNGRARLLVGNLEDLVADLEGPYDLIVYDRAALAPLGGTRGLSRGAREALASRLAPAGAVAWGPYPVQDAGPERHEGWGYVVYHRALEITGSAEVGSPESETLLVGRRERGAPLPEGIDGFRREERSESPQ